MRKGAGVSCGLRYELIYNYMIRIFLLIVFWLPAIIFSQNSCEVSFIITDTVLVQKKVKNRDEYAIKVNVELYAPHLQDPLFLYCFNKYVPAHLFTVNMNSFEMPKEKSIGLIYVIEDTNHRIISPMNSILGGNRIILDKRPFVSSKQKIFYKRLDEKEEWEYDLAKYRISNVKQRLELFPLLGKYHPYKLPKGEYYLFLVYSYYGATVYFRQLSSGALNNDKLDASKIFRGCFISNKVKLVVE